MTLNEKFHMYSKRMITSLTQMHNNDIYTEIYSELTTEEKTLHPKSSIELLVILYSQIADDYESHIFDRVQHIDLFDAKGFDDTIDGAVVCDYIEKELRKDNIVLERDFIIKVIGQIRKYNGKL